MESKNAISSWSKEKLEDQYLRLYDDYLTLKKHACKQEERIKKMATKILRLASDKKDSDPGSVLKEDYQEQIEVLERKNATLTRKLALVQNQLNVQKQRIGSAPLSARKASSATIQTTGRNSCVGEKPMNNSNVIQTLRFQNSAFEKTIQKLSGQLKERNELIDQLKEELQIKEKIHTNDLVTLGEQVTSKQRIALQENLDLIRTQRELREKQLLINHLEERIKEAESNYNIIKSTNRQLVIEIERLTRESSQLEQKLFSLQSDNNLASKQQLKILELQYAFDDAKRENQALKESNEKLIANAFSIKPEQNWTLKEQKLRGQIDHLEMMVHNLQQQLKQTEQQEKHSAVEEKIIPNRQQSNQLESIPNKQVDKVNSNDQATVTNTTTQMFAQITGFTVEELEDAIMMLRERKSKSQSVDEHLLPNSDKYLLGQNKDPLKPLNESELLHIDTINELEKTRKLLHNQYKINKNYQIEIKQLTDHLTEYKLETEQHLIEYKNLLNQRNEQIKQLKNQLHNLLYNSINKYKGDQLPNDKLTTEDALKPGESLIEFHVGQLHLLPSLLYKYQTNSSPTTNNNQNNHITEESINLFLTWDFYDYETQATPILLIQNSIDLNMTIQYPIEINDTLMNYLIKEPCTIEMHQVINSNYRTIAVGKLNFTQLFTGKDDSIEIPDQGSIVRRQGQLDLFLISTPNNSINIKENEKIKFGTLDYWIRLTAPMLDSIKLYKERFQQLPGSISFTNKSSIHHEELHSTDLSKNILTIEIMKITNLIQQRLNYLPSIYFVYQFYNELEYASMIIKQNNTPIFNDLHTIQLEMNDELDNYLKTQNLNIYIVDSTDPSPETSCLGLAIIPLIGLINKNQKIDGIFEIFPLTTLKKRQQSNQINKNQSNCGLLYLKMYWQRPYTVTTTTTTTNSRNTVVYNQPNMEESKDLEMEPVKQAAEKPYITQYESSKEACLQPKSSSNVSFAKPIDKLNPSDNLPNNSTRKKQDTPDLDQVIVKVPELTVNKTDNQIPNPSDDNPKINTKTNEMLSSSSPSIQSQLEDSGKQSIVPTPHPRTKTSEPQNLKIDLLNQSITSKKTISKTNQDPEPSSSIFTDENHVKIELHGLQLINLSKLLKSNQTLPCQIFIEYSFLGYKEPFETSTYPLIEWIDNNKNILKSNFYYTKTFPVDFTENYERRQYLASYLLPEDPNNGNIIFIIVSEPSTSTTTQSAECEEIGYAMINIRQIIQDNCDIDHVFIPITAAKAVDGETESLNEIGRLCVSFYGLSALHAIIAEMPQVKLAI
ncbi:unnamed protein product [Schistosoma rodhaini]|uniref:Rpgr-interacting protein 1 related n=1 Tax=Schistosoma mansoni TaxID=6183 RepID=A0A3Q0KRJ3_SCHMA|nr:unnamed protein product [Schistosoma rodhaini]